MKNHTDLLNFLIQTFDLKSYLEIGVQNPKNNFDKIKCIDKTGVDPIYVRGDILVTTSDLFFDWNENKKFDLIFIDGLHHANQVRRDFENSLKCLNDNGFIVIHDTLPTDEKYTHVPRDSKIWFGDVYKFAMTLSEYDKIGFLTIDFDCGCTVVYKHAGKNGVKHSKHTKPNWEFFQKHKSLLLRIVSVNDFIKTFSEIAIFRQDLEKLFITT